MKVPLSVINEKFVVEIIRNVQHNDFIRVVLDTSFSIFDQQYILCIRQPVVAREIAAQLLDRADKLEGIARSIKPLSGSVPHLDHQCWCGSDICGKRSIKPVAEPEPSTTCARCGTEPNKDNQCWCVGDAVMCTKCGALVIGDISDHRVCAVSANE